jgi:hypothetical protein
VIGKEEPNSMCCVASTPGEKPPEARIERGNISRVRSMSVTIAVVLPSVVLTEVVHRVFDMFSSMISPIL